MPTNPTAKLVINGTTYDLVDETSTFSTTEGAHEVVTNATGSISIKIPTTAAHVGAAASDHTHTTTLTTDTGTSSITLASAGKYKLTAGGTSVIFTMPTIPTVSYPVTSVNTKTGDVTLSASDVGAAASSHSHGNITSGGDITATAPTIANGDQIIINDSSASKITNGPTFDGSTTSKYLSQKGTWESLPQGTAYQAGTGLSLSGTTFNHSNSVTTQTTQAVYPIKIDAQGHISDYGSAITSMPASDVYDWAKASTKPTYTASEVGAAAESHTHGYLKNDGTFSSQMPIANGDYLVVADHSNSDKLCYTTLAFDGSTTTKALTQKGTWETFLTTEQYTGTVTGVKINGTTKSPSSGIVDIGTVATTDTDTTYSLSNALSSHKFTWTFTAGGSGSGSTTTTAELVAGTGISLTDDTTNKKITIESTVTNTDTKLQISKVSTDTTYYPIVALDSTTAAERQYITNISVLNHPAGSGAGYVRLTLGNLLTTSQAAKGGIRFNNGANGYYTDIYGHSSLSENNTVYLPATGGTLALTSQIPSVSGFITSAVLTGTYDSSTKNLTLSVSTS